MHSWPEVPSDAPRRLELQYSARSQRYEDDTGNKIQWPVASHFMLSTVTVMKIIDVSF
jgi:hypothetical protein